jgi:hypothetical protein
MNNNIIERRGQSPRTQRVYKTAKYPKDYYSKALDRIKRYKEDTSTDLPSQTFNLFKLASLEVRRKQLIK